LLAVLAGVLMFWELGADALTADEAQYALVVQNIKRSHEWLYVSPYPPAPYFQKPPLYFWLTAATYDRLGGPDEFAYRAWSAAAGVGTIVLTCLLGAMLLTPEIGALAALLVMTNRLFVMVHGARSGTLDALVTLLITGGIVTYWAAGRGRRGWIGWIGIGIFAGLASLTKPFVGVPLVILLAVHSLVVERGHASLARRAIGVLVGILVLAAVAGPWYAAQAHKYPAFAGEMFGKNLVQRVTRGLDEAQLERWYFYPEAITKSSLPFALAIPAIIFACGVWIAGGPKWRSRYALLAITGGGWVLLFSMSASKAPHYVYPGFPAIAITIAASAVVLGQRIAERASALSSSAASSSSLSLRRARLAVVIAIGATACFAFQYARTLFRSIPADRSAYVPWEMYRALSPAMRSGDARMIFAGFPELQTQWRAVLGLRSRDCYYLEQLRERPAAVRTRDAHELEHAVEQRSPALLILSARENPQHWLDELARQQRTDARFVYAHQGYMVIGADLRPLLDPIATSGQANPRLRVEPAATPGEFRLTIDPAVRGGIDVSTRARVDSLPPGSAVRYVYTLDSDNQHKTIEDQVVTTSPDAALEVSATMEEPLLVQPGPYHLTLTLRDARSPLLAPVRSTVEVARVRFLPAIAPEQHPRR
jgi:4-amino-4-deoxy-L-arabinose transferase-like glycosyltransferase